MFAAGFSNPNAEEVVQPLRRLEFELNIYFCVYSLHPCTSGTLKKSSV